MKKAISVIVVVLVAIFIVAFTGGRPESGQTGLGKAFAIALSVSLAEGPFVIPLLRKLKFGQSIRSDGPARHLQKAGTPTMGGVIFLGGLLAAGIVTARGSLDALIVVGMAMGYGLIGFLDDYIKVVLKRSLGLRAREKLLGQVLLAVVLVFLLTSVLGRGTDLAVPFSGFFHPGGIYLTPPLWLFTLFTILMAVGMANAVNLTDGLDGLAGGVSLLVAAAMAAIALAAGKTGVALAMAALAGGCLGFLYYNRHPAKVFMGDTGSLALGGALMLPAVSAFAATTSRPRFVATEPPPTLPNATVRPVDKIPSPSEPWTLSAGPFPSRCPRPTPYRLPQ
ncbi:MAG: phospho-N-acetylmuramoyl-pentapeptide-transferase [Peptococcaceae bacterium]|nr:phospho-N-acetylmuramoyl-pentapeptide-transferase [Peptococcaceae bacterium]